MAFASRAVNPTERNYSITDLETLAVVWAVSHFRTYLYGQKVTIYTDHAAVKAVLQNPSSSGRNARWWTKVYGSGLKEVHIIYRAGRKNTIADALSRSPQGSAPREGLAENEVQVASVAGSALEEEGELQVAQLLQVEPVPDPEWPSETLADE